ncbi:MAG: hypothetical protein K1X49_05525 [Saprospiraceae bacterium]|nr:hypothetical protein [Saprospiraceae bacterium]
MRVYLVLLMTALGLSYLHSQTEKIYLSGWEWNISSQKEWYPCTIPGNHISALIENHMIQSPYKGINEFNAQIYNAESNQYRSYFDLTELQMNASHVWWECDGLDTYCEIWINGKLVGESNNAFRRWRYDIKNYIQKGRNECLIHIKSADLISQKLYSKQITPLPGEARVTIRKPQYHFGWDFGPKLISNGISSLPEIIINQNIHCDYASLQTMKIQKGKAELELMVEYTASNSDEYEFELLMDDRKFIFQENLEAGTHLFRKKIKIKNPELWWPNGNGNQKLYRVTLNARSKNLNHHFSKQWQCGIRQIKLVHENDKDGKSFYFLVNGEQIFIKGSNYIPPDILKPDADPIQLLQDAKACHFNMLRIWGGGTYETERFYQLCDSLGILIWQDFMFACGMYPGDEDFLDNVLAEADHQVKRISAHACLALWCGNNEISEGWDRWGWQTLLAKSIKSKLSSDYDKLFKSILPTAVQSFSRTDYWESSPLFGRGDSRFQSEGDAHDWGVWHDEMPFDVFETRVPRFMSEAGFQSLPSLSTIVQIADSSEWDLQSPSLLSHQKHPRGNKLISKYIQHDFPDPTNFPDMIYLSQLTQADGMAVGIEAHRRAKPYCMGTLYWQYNDCWPGISWSGREYSGRWKALQHKTKEIYKPVLISAESKFNLVHVFATSDLLYPYTDSLDIKIIETKGKTIWQEKINFQLKANESKIVYEMDIAKLSFPFDVHNHILVLQPFNQKMSNIKWQLFDVPKKIKWEETQFEMTSITNYNGVYSFFITCNNPAKGVYLQESENIRYFPNYFDILPGQKLKIRIENNSPVSALLPEKIICINQLIR